MVSKMALALSFAYILLVWFVPLSLSTVHEVPAAISIAEEHLGSCDGDIQDGSFLGPNFPAAPSREGLVAQNLMDISSEIFEQGDPLYTTEIPIVQIFDYTVVCRSLFSWTAGYSTMTVLVYYSCFGKACTRDPSITIERTYTHLFSFFCQMNGVWTLQDKVESANIIDFSGHNNRDHDNSRTNPKIAVDGKCSVCTANPDNALRYSDSPYDPTTGCVCMLNS